MVSSSTTSISSSSENPAALRGLVLFITASHPHDRAQRNRGDKAYPFVRRHEWLPRCNNQQLARVAWTDCGNVPAHVIGRLQPVRAANRVVHLITRDRGLAEIDIAVVLQRGA